MSGSESGRRRIEIIANRADGSLRARLCGILLRVLHSPSQGPPAGGDGEGFPRLLELDVGEFRSFWHPDFADRLQSEDLREGLPAYIRGKGWDPDHVRRLADEFAAGETVTPVLVVKGPGAGYTIVDGHNRVLAAFLAGRKTIPAVCLEGDFLSTRFLREIEVKLKRYDKATGHRYGFGRMVRLWTQWFAERDREGPGG